MLPEAGAPRPSPSHRLPHHPGLRVEWRTLPRAHGKSYAIVWLGSEPVNSMTLELWSALRDTLAALEGDAKTSGVVFASELRKPVFTAGNDIGELYAKKTNAARYAQFWRAQSVFLTHLLRSPLATACAIRGACPAGGCAVALCCDFRAQTDFGTFGLNEVELGIPVPKFWGKLFVSRATNAVEAENALMRGTLLAPSEAKALGLVDEIVPEAALTLATERAMERMLRTPDDARAATKANLRGDFSREWEAFIETEATNGWEMLASPEIEAALGEVVRRLSSKGGGRRDGSPPGETSARARERAPAAARAKL